MEIWESQYADFYHDLQRAREDEALRLRRHSTSAQSERHNQREEELGLWRGRADGAQVESQSPKRRRISSSTEAGEDVASSNSTPIRSGVGTIANSSPDHADQRGLFAEATTEARWTFNEGPAPGFTFDIEEHVDWNSIFQGSPYAIATDA